LHHFKSIHYNLESELNTGNFNLEDTESTLSLKNWRGTGTKVSQICCSSSPHVFDFEHYTSWLAQPHRDHRV